MSRSEIKVEINLLDQTSPHVLGIEVVDREILNEEDVDYILGSLPSVSTARLDADNYKPFLGIDMFYDEEASLKGVIFVFESHALAIRVPANVAKTSAKAYEEKATSRPNVKLRGKPRSEAATRLTNLECLRKLLQSDLAGFGMTQISFTLWHFLRERVSGVNLSTAASGQITPPIRTMPEPNSEDGVKPNEGTQNAQQAPGGKGNKGGSGKRKNDRGGVKDGRKGSQRDKPAENPGGKNDSVSPVILPDDEPLNWDREILSPGEVLKKVYPDVSITDVNAAFISSDEATMDLEARIAEAATRAWISSVVADMLNAEVQNAPVVQPAHLRDKELTFFAESMVAKWKVLGETSPLRKLELDQFEDDDGLLKSNKYETKLRAGNVAMQYLTYTQDGVEKRLYLRRPGDRTKTKHTYLAEDEDDKPEPPSRQKPDTDGWSLASGRKRGSHQQRRGQIRDYGEETSEFQSPNSSAASHNPKKGGFKLPEGVDNIHVYGREEAPQSDKQRDMFMLRLLEGRGSLHGPKYRDCAFIRRVWFPTYVQISIGEQRGRKKTKATRGKDDWIDDDWDDDTDDEEVARMKALTFEEGDEDTDDETEDEELGMRDPERGVSLPTAITLNKSQRNVVDRVVAPNPRGRTRATLVHGPPGTGKTSTIAAAVWIFGEIGEPAWVIAQSNVGIRNVAEKLQKVGFDNFVLLVSRDYYAYWQPRYKNLEKHTLPTPQLKSEKYQKRLFESKAVLCTLATLSSPILDECGAFVRRPLQHLIIDEASQIDMTSEFMHLFYKHRSTLKSVCWFGDPKQLPPFGWSEEAEIQDIFKVKHFLANSRLLDTSYRLPVPIARYISRAVYQGELKESRKTPDIQPPEKAIVFVDVADGKEESAGKEGKSWQNPLEAEVVAQLVQTYYERPIKQDWQSEEKFPEYGIITPYEAQRSYVEGQLKKVGNQKQVYNGNEADFIITTIAKTGSPGFLTSINRLNVLLTRCKRGLIVVTQKDFVQRAGGLLQGLWFSLEPYDPWVSSKDVLEGYVDLPGSPAPNVRPPTPEEAPRAPASRQDIPPRPGTSSQPSAAHVVKQGMQPPAPSRPNAVKGVWGQAQGLSRVKDPRGRGI